jgi:hypothetical protein
MPTWNHLPALSDRSQPVPFGLMRGKLSRVLEIVPIAMGADSSVASGVHILVLQRVPVDAAPTALDLVHACRCVYRKFDSE